VERLHLVHQIVPELQQELQRIRYWRVTILESVATLIQANKDEMAIVEPVAGNMGCIPPNKGFLEGLRQMCTAIMAYIDDFDEVMTDSDCQRAVFRNC
jgi:glutamate-1-semialdehyde aminotransferase